MLAVAPLLRYIPTQTCAETPLHILLECMKSKEHRLVQLRSLQHERRLLLPKVSSLAQVAVCSHEEWLAYKRGSYCHPRYRDCTCVDPRQHCSVTTAAVQPRHMENGIKNESYSRAHTRTIHWQVSILGTRAFSCKLAALLFLLVVCLLAMHAPSCDISSWRDHITFSSLSPSQFVQ